MASHVVTLDKGWTIGETVHQEVELREPTAGDLIEATEEGERLVRSPDGGFALVVSEPLVGLHTLRRQIVRVGDYTGEVTLAMLKKLSATDLSLLQEGAQQLDRAMLQEVASRGRD